MQYEKTKASFYNSAFALVLSGHFILWHSMKFNDMLGCFQQLGTDIYFRNKGLVIHLLGCTWLILDAL